MLAHEAGWIEAGGKGLVAPNADKKVASPTPEKKGRFEMLEMDSKPKIPKK